jgi:hypothetical protein
MAAVDELVQHIEGTVGIGHDVAEKSVAIILDFLIKEAPEDALSGLLAAFPGAREAAAAAPGGEGMFGGMGGLMGAANRLMGAGLTMSQVQTVTREVVAFARKKAGEDAVGQLVGSIPGLSQIV